MNENKLLKNIAMLVGFIAIIASIAGGVYAVIKYFDRKQEEEFMDYYFDDNDDVEYDGDDEETEEKAEEADKEAE